MSRASGEQNRRKRAPSTLPALLTKGDVRKCVQAGLLPPTIYRATEPTEEYSGGFYKSAKDKLMLEKRHADWIQRGMTRCPPPLPRARFKPRRLKSETRMKMLMRAQHGFCYLCGEPIRATDRSNLDHVIPKAKGGKDRGNMLATHYDCNQMKADRDPRPCEMIYLLATNLRRLALPEASPSSEPAPR